LHKEKQNSIIQFSKKKSNAQRRKKLVDIAASDARKLFSRKAARDMFCYFIVK